MSRSSHKRMRCYGEGKPLLDLLGKQCNGGTSDNGEEWSKRDKLFAYCLCIVHTLLILKKGQNAHPQCVYYSEDPLYIHTKFSVSEAYKTHRQYI